jgi:hypothetical protein
MSDTLFTFADVDYATATTLEERFEVFHKANPAVYEELRRLALILKRRGHKRIGIAMLYEQMRWSWYVQTTDVDGFKLSNNHRAYYSRLLMKQEPELAGFFTTRETQ